MTALTTHANLVDLSALGEDSRLAVTLERSEVEALLGAEGSPLLWFELGVEGEEEPQRLTFELTDDDLRVLLSGSTGSEITLAVDGEALASLLDEPEVEAHGLRGAIAVSVAIATAAIAAPSALGATQQSVGTAATSQAVSAAVSSQQVGAAATTQVSSQIVRSHVARGAARSQRASALKFSQLTILRAGAVR